MQISIITAIHNGLAINKLFYNYLKKYTHYKFELIIIDNCSEDGSREFFENLPEVKLIKNSHNYSYPYTQNQGIKIATSPYLFFLNNDIIVSPNWDKHLIDISISQNIDILSAKGIENTGFKELDKQYALKWKLVKNPFKLIGYNQYTLPIIHKLMYGNWEKFCQKQFKTYQQQTKIGIVGNNVMMTKKAIDKIGLWDERLQAADWDLYLRASKRAEEYKDIKPCHIALGVFIHHFVRMTLKYAAIKPMPFYDKGNLIPMHEKWSNEEIEKYGIKPNK